MERPEVRGPLGPGSREQGPNWKEEGERDRQGAGPGQTSMGQVASGRMGVPSRETEAELSTPPPPP